MIEIGPGRGALTDRLLDRLDHLHVVELDRDLAAWWRQRITPDRLTVHEADALQLRLPAPCDDRRCWRLIGNLPYNISTPLLFHLLDQHDSITDMLFMLQREVAARITASPGTREYGRLTVMLALRCQVASVMNVPRAAFSPSPRVLSRVVSITPFTEPPWQVNDVSHLRKLVAAAFSQRRKTLRNAIAGMAAPAVIDATGIDSRRRPDTLTAAEFVRLSNAAVAVG